MKLTQIFLFFIVLISVVFSRRHRRHRSKLTCTDKGKGKGSQTLYKMVAGKNTAYCGCNHHLDCSSDDCNTTTHLCK